MTAMSPSTTPSTSPGSQGPALVRAARFATVTAPCRVADDADCMASTLDDGARLGLEDGEGGEALHRRAGMHDLRVDAVVGDRPRSSRRSQQGVAVVGQHDDARGTGRVLGPDRVDEGPGRRPSARPGRHDRGTRLAEEGREPVAGRARHDRRSGMPRGGVRG